MTSALDVFLRAVSAEDEAAADSAAVQLASTDEPVILARLVAAQNDEERWWMTRALASCGSAAALPVLTVRLTDDDAAERATAALALAHIAQRHPAAPVALPVIANLLQDEEGFVRQAGADALALCGDAAVPVLHDVLHGEHEGARSRAMAALRKIATLAAAGVMFQYLNDENYLVRTYAYEGLDEMGLLENLLLQI